MGCCTLTECKLHKLHDDVGASCSAMWPLPATSCLCLQLFLLVSASQAFLLNLCIFRCTTINSPLATTITGRQMQGVQHRLTASALQRAKQRPAHLSLAQERPWLVAVLGVSPLWLSYTIACTGNLCLPCSSIPWALPLQAR